MSNLTLHKPHHVRNVVLVILLIPVCLLAALWFVAFAIDIFDRSQRIEQGDFRPAPTVSTPAPAVPYEGADKALIEGKNNFSIGAAEPKVTIVQFSDFACPFCRASFPALREVSVRHKDTVKIIFRDWPGHTSSLPLSFAAYCAGEQGKFWEMHDKLFQNQSDTFGNDKNQLAGLAQQLGVYNEKFQTCFDSQKYLPQIRQNFVDSQTLGVKGTPTWFINGRMIQGQLNASELEQLITEALTPSL